MVSRGLQILLVNLAKQMIDEITGEIENVVGIVTEDVVEIEIETEDVQRTLKDRATGQ